MANILNYTCLLIVLVSMASAAPNGVLTCKTLGQNKLGQNHECPYDMWCAVTPGTAQKTCQICNCSSWPCLLHPDTGILVCICTEKFCHGR